MSDTVITVESVGKRYLISHLAEKREQLFSRLLANKVKSVFRHGKKVLSLSSLPITDSQEEFWALRDVSFEIRRGERVGIIGRNGAGKSTLLKILSRITEPTTGKITIDGRVASLLEVGTGFHSELSGRENIYLNGAILGMGREEIRRKFDEIVAFAEVERFLDTPVKRYSSGMYVRLAFAVAAHLVPELLIGDEGLAGGDAHFQKKCLGKMEDVSTKEGRTVLFVSHNMNAIEQLCTRALLLEKGRLNTTGADIRSIVRDYLYGHEEGTTSAEWVNHDGDFNNPWFKPVRFYLSDGSGNRLCAAVSNDSETWVRIEGEVEEIDPALTVGYSIFSEDGNLLYWSYCTDSRQEEWPEINKGMITLQGRIPARLLNEGTYRIELIASLHYRLWICEPSVSAPSIHMIIQGGLSDSPYWMTKRPGLLAPVIEWRGGK